jgi:hypothetical protein
MRFTSASPRARARKSLSASRDGISRAAIWGTGLKPARRSAAAGIDVVAVVVAGQKGNRHVRARAEIIPQLGQLMPAR